jgi:hypothetical protein
VGSGISCTSVTRNIHWVRCIAKGFAKDAGARRWLGRGTGALSFAFDLLAKGDVGKTADDCYPRRGNGML